MIAEMARDVEAARLLVWRAAWQDRPEGAGVFSRPPMPSSSRPTPAMRVTTDAVQIFGGYGYSREYPVEKLMRDAKVFQIYEGTSQIQRLIISREIISRGTA